MSATEYAGVITNVEATSSHVKVQLDTVPGKTLTWLMTMFIEKPRPEVGKRLVCTARPGPHEELYVQRLISVSDPSPEVLRTEVHRTSTPVESSPDPTTLPLPSDASLLERLAERILELKAKCKETFAQGLLDFKWEVGREISVSRGKQEPATFRELEERTGIDHVELFRCVKFFAKFPSKGYELKAWRELRAELPAGKEPAKESKDKSANGKAFKEAETLGRERGYQTIRCPHCAKPLWLNWKGGELHNPLAEADEK